MRKKRAKRALTEFELALVSSCLAGKIVRNEYTVETTPAELSAAVQGWLVIARSAQEGLSGGKKRA